MRERSTPQTGAKLLTLVIAGALGLGAVATSVSALLQAQTSNTSAQNITSGTLKLIQADNGVGFSTTIADMAPGDVVNRYVNYTNSGTLASKALRLKVVDSASPQTLLSTSATRGLQLVVTNCSIAWAPTAGTCGGTTTEVLSQSLSAMTSDIALNNITTLASNDVLHLQFKLTLPDGTNNETTTNGALPSNSIQGLGAALTWTLSETQRDLTTTNS